MNLDSRQDFESLITSFSHQLNLTTSAQLCYVSKKGDLKFLNLFNHGSFSTSAKSVYKFNRLIESGNIAIIDSANKVIHLHQGLSNSAVVTRQCEGYSRRIISEEVFADLCQRIREVLSRLQVTLSSGTKTAPAMHEYRIANRDSVQACTGLKSLFGADKLSPTFRRAQTRIAIAERRSAKHKREAQQRRDKRQAIQTELRARQHDEQLFEARFSY